MQITEKQFNSVLCELIDENPLACRALLRIADTVFTDEVPTLAMTLGEERPRLLVNIEFLRRHCENETHVKAVIIHEFLHVLLNHTEKFTKMTPALNLALDGVINAIIHRMLGEQYSNMMSRLYADAKGVARLLRPFAYTEFWNGFRDSKEEQFRDVWLDLYTGNLVVDDLLEIAEEIGQLCKSASEPIFLGDHSDKEASPTEISEATKEAIDVTLRSMTGGGIWRSGRERGIGSPVTTGVGAAASRELSLWEREAIAVLKKCITPDSLSRNSASATIEHVLPILNSSDKRGFLKSVWSPLLPDILWTAEVKKPVGTAQIYLDVSGSMNEEMDALVALLWRVRKWIRFPFWAFSDIIAPATIKDGKLKSSTTGGTSINAVLEHVALTRPKRAVIVTDGFIEPCDTKLLAKLVGQQIFAIVSRNGNGSEFERAGIPYFQLPRFKNDSNG